MQLKFAESIKEYVTEHLPEQYHIYLCTLDTILKHAFEILETHKRMEKAAANGTLQGYVVSESEIII
jgi:hypothetical protein